MEETTERSVATHGPQAEGDGNTSGRPWPAIRAHPWRTAVTGATAALGLWLLLGTDLAAAQRRAPLELARLVFDNETGEALADLQNAAVLDLVFTVGYVLTVLWLIWWLRDAPFKSGRVRGRQHTGAFVGAVTVVGAGLADLIENATLLKQLGRLNGDELERLLPMKDAADPGALAAAGVDARGDELLQAMRIAGLVKWGLLTMTLLILVDLANRKREARTDYTEQVSTDTPPRDVVADWTAKENGHRGICLSGGGIRSASFSLGALQALKEKEWLDDADYLAAVSGGGYLAAGWAVSNAQSGTEPPEDPAPWSPRSPEERWFRSHSSYLIPDLWQGMKGVGRLLAGIAVNLVLVWAVLFLGARPVGWLIHELHPELRPASPLTLPRDLESGFTLGDITEVESVTRGEDGVEVEVRRFRVDVTGTFDGDGEVPQADSLADADNDVELEVAPFADSTVERYPIEQVEPGLIELRQGVFTIIRNPEVRPRVEACEHDETGDRAERRCKNVKELLRVTQQPALAADDRPVGTIPEISESVPVAEFAIIRDRLSVGSALIARTDATETRDEVAYPRWMWVSSLGLLGAGLLLALAAMMRRSSGRLGQQLRYASGVALVAGLTWFAVLIALPWLLDELPDRVSALTKEGGAQYERLREELIIPAGGFLALAIAAVSQYLSANRAATGKEKTSPSWWHRLRRQSASRSTELGWYELSPSKILAGIALVIVPLFLVVGQLQYAVANGWNGRLVSVGWVQSWLPPVLQPDIVRWGLVGLGLAGLAVLADAHAWSLHPFYKRRLQGAYLLERQAPKGPHDPPAAADRPYDQPIPFTEHEDSGWPGLRRQPPRSTETDENGVPSGPQLILCSAANLSEVNRVPPGRRSASFTFSSDVIGGPVVGWARAEDYWGQLSEARQRDITVPSAMSISGAAFSPTMGKANLGPVGAILAMANLRLGVWIPHPQWVTRLADGDGTERSEGWWARRRPGWPWFFNELTNRYAFQSPYLYVSDGGHWDNLGLVELLRRGCTEVICVNAGGDNQQSFGTIAEAIALAREELGVEIEINPSALRPPLKAESGDRELRRGANRNEVEPFAAVSAVAGDIVYPAEDGADPVTGKLYLIEPALTDDLPFDVHGFAESETIFPDNDTADQVYNHRQFESFRRLGFHQATAALQLRKKANAGAVDGGSTPED